MTRSVKDLREIICVSRLNGIDNLNNLYEKSNDDTINEFDVNKSKKKSDIQKNIKNNAQFKVQNDMSEYELWYRIIDEDALKELLNRANKDLEWLSTWAVEDNRRVHFMHWWLADVSRSDRKDLINLEYEIACTEVLVIIKRHCTEIAIADKATKYLLSIVLWEYPDSILGQSGSYLFLEYLDKLVSHDCKHLLSAVSIVTNDPHTIHYCLSVRAFVLMSLWSSLVRFHDQLLHTAALTLSPLLSHLPPGDSFLSLLSIAMSHEFIPVIQYWIQRQKIDLETFRDNEGRNLITLAVSFKSKSVVKYLLDNFDVSRIINSASKAGNSALHLAVCQGSLEMVQMLVDDGHADLDVPNTDCDDCTALHMAAIYGQEEIAKFLIERGADSGAKTAREGSTADMAAIFQETEMADLLAHMLQVANETDNDRRTLGPD